MAGQPTTTQTAGIIGRWRPVHRGHQAVLHALSDHYAHVLVGVGSANVLDVRNPFTLVETMEMLRLATLGRDNITFVPVEDFPADADWCDLMEELFGRTNVFYSANPFVKHLLQPSFPVHHPAALLTATQKIKISGTEVRRRLARGLAVDDLVPPEVHAYIRQHHLDDRFRQQFGLHMLALEIVIVA